MKDVFGELGISDATYYARNSDYRGMQASDVLRLRQLEDSNTMLKLMRAKFSLEVTASKEVIAKKK